MITVMVGLPASGKSTYASIIAKTECAILLSSDKIREELYGSEEMQGNPADVFSILYKRAEKAVLELQDVVIDATNINKRDRAAAIALARNHDCYIRAIVIDTPISVCIRRNDARERKVPDRVYDRMISKYEEPTLSEGFDMVIKERRW